MNDPAARIVSLPVPPLSAIEEWEKQFFRAERWKNAFFLLLLLINILFLSAALSGCATAETTPPALNLYEPLNLPISKGTTIQTKEGLYTAQTDTTLWSDREYRELNDKYIQLLAETAQK